MISGNSWVNINDGTFIQNNYVVKQDPGLFKLNPVSSAGIHALDEDGCMEGTRVSLLDDLQRWGTDAAAHRIFWLDGMAGTGKSAIARSFCRFLNERGLLGGSFFCLRGNESRANVKRILPTLAWFLARQDLHYQKSLLDVLREAPDVAEYSIERQVEFLLQNPLRNRETTRNPLVLVIDALDECANAEEVARLLKKLLSIGVDLPIKFFLTSRPERHILTHFKSGLHRILRLHDIHQDLVEMDIFLYLNKRLTDIRSNSDISSMFSASWPARKDVETLTRLSGKLFIYAFTAVQYIEDENPIDRLRTLTGLKVDDNDNQPFHGPLDEMYSLVLSTALDPKKRRREEICLTKRVLGTIFALREPLFLSDLARLLGVAPHVIRVNIDRVHALINVPPHNKDGVVSTFHASLIDFLTTERASEKMRIKLTVAHEDVANRCLEIMNSDLHFNIANCKTSYLLNSEQTLATIPTLLRYSCLRWADHVVAVDNAASLMLHVEKVLLEKFLFWLEVLSVIGMVSSSSSSLIRVLTADTTKRCMTDNLSTFLHDANYFVVVFREVIESCIPHIYLSALPSSLRTSKIAEVFTAKYPFTIKVGAFGIQHRRKPVLELRGHLLPVNSVAFSRDGTRIASGSDDKTIRIWDAKTGEEVVGPLKGHTSYVRTVAFSPDGTRIVSGSSDKTIRIWDAKTGVEVVEPLKGHTSSVRSVAISPDGTRIVSGSSDRTIWVWDAKTGDEVVENLKGHTGYVLSVAFSPDGTRIVSASEDKTIRVWDAKTGVEVVEPFKGHTDYVRSVAFSPDGARIVSGSLDKTIRVWDAKTGEEVVGPLKGHTDYVQSVAISPDGTRIVSGSSDKAIRIWDAKTGVEVVEPLKGHTDYVRSVAFSPDGTRIVSGSLDITIRIWDLKTGVEVIEPLKGHTSSILSVAFSPDGTRIVSGSSDETIRIWDVKTGVEVVEHLKGHTDYVQSVAFSPDGTRIVSGSSDKAIRIWDLKTDGTRIVSGSSDETIRIWDVKTGEEVVGPLKGHTSYVRSVAISPDGTRIVSGSLDKTIRIWDAKTGEEVVEPLKGHTHCVLSVAFSPDGARIVSGSLDTTIRIWDAKTGVGVGPLKGHTDYVLSVAFSPDGTRIVSGSLDKTIRIWDLKTGVEVVDPLKGHSDYVQSVAFSPDGTRIVSASEDKTIRIWDAKTAGASNSILFYHYCALSPSNGWIEGPAKELIFWVLPEWRPFVVWPPCLSLIAQSRIVVDPHYSVHGTDWTRCAASS